MTAEMTIEALLAQLDSNVADVEVRLVLADALEEDGQTELAARHRKIAALRPTNGLDDDDLFAIRDLYATEWAEELAEFDFPQDEIRITKGYDGDLRVHFYHVSGDDAGHLVDETTYFCCQADGAFDYNRL